MRFVIDAHLPVSLVNYFEGHDVLHTLSLKDGNFTADQNINEISLTQKRVVITKDSDFYHSFITFRKPYKLVFVKLGNMRLRDLKSYFERNSEQLITLLEDHSFIILEPDRIRVLD